MAKQSLGYVELEWVCPFCNTRNPGRAKVCRNCGAAQPKDVQFEQAAEDAVVTDAEGLEMAKAGPDIHCPFCGTRNPAGATQCLRCGGDLTEAEKRESGQVLGAAQTKPAPEITCQYCGTKNKATNVKCTNCGSPLHKEPRPAPAPATAPAKMNPTWLIIGGLIALVLCGALAFFLMRGMQSDTRVAEVSDVSWKRSIAVLGLVPIRAGAWEDQLPSGADVNSCTERERGRSAFPTENSQEICGTPYVVDQGSGFGEMVQDCEYIVYDTYCDYTTLQLAPVGVVEETGSDLNPFWPQTRLDQGQQEGERNEVYEIEFVVDGETYTYRTTNASEYAQFRPGSEWELEVNGFGDIVGIQPAP